MPCSCVLCRPTAIRVPLLFCKRQKQLVRPYWLWQCRRTMWFFSSPPCHPQKNLTSPHTHTHNACVHMQKCASTLARSLTYTHTKPNAVEQPSVKVCWRCRSGGIYIDRWWRDYGALGLLITLLRRRRGTPWCHSSLQGWVFTLDMSFVPFPMFYLLPS